MRDFKRAVSAILMTAILLGMCGCSRGERGSSGLSEDSGKKRNEKSEVVNPAVGNWSAEKDPIFGVHETNNREAAVEKPQPPTAGKFDIYIENVQALTGYTAEAGRTEYQDSVQSAFTAASAMFGANAITAHTLAKDAGELQWQQEEDGRFRNAWVAPDFYRNNVLPEVGPLEQLFRDGQSPFQREGLTAIISNLSEPGFELSPLYQGIEKYFDTCDHSAAAVIGFASRFDGNVYIPTNGYSMEGTTFRVEDFSGNLPAYIIVVGPEASVREYVTRVTDIMTSQSVLCDYSLFTNSVHEREQAKPLRFAMVEDLKVRKLEEPTYTSFNSGSVVWNDDGTAFFLTYNGSETRGESSPYGSSTARCTQLSLVSENYDGHSEYAVDWSLLVLDETTGQWMDAGKNACDMVRLESRTLNGEIVDTVADQDVVVQTKGNKQVFLRARLNFDTDSVLKRRNLYRLEVHLRLDQPGDPNYRNETMDALTDYSITGVGYYQAISKLCTLSHGNYAFRGGSIRQADREAAGDAMQRTPNLDALLHNLETLEDKYPFDETVTQYVDLVFNLPGEKSGR